MSCCRSGIERRLDQTKARKMAFINLEGGSSPFNIAVRIGATLAVLALLYNLVQLVRVRYTFWRWKKQGVVGGTSNEAIAIRTC